MMKLGQMASYLDQGMPEHVRSALAELQSNAPPMSPELAAGVIVDQLGAPPEELFAEWDPHPIASASIGQVHRAITRDGRAVAVKVQYPGVSEAIRADLDNTDLVMSAFKMMFPGLDPAPMVREIKERLSEELDYRLEADHQQMFAEEYRAHPTITVPDVVRELSAEKVLTTDLAEGVPFAEMERWTQEERNLAAETIFRFVFHGLYRMLAFNGDPHPGNYLFLSGGRVTFLDFGLVKRFTHTEMDQFGEMVKAMVLDHDIAAYRTLVEDYGIIEPGWVSPTTQILAYFRHFYEFLMTDEVSTIDAAYASEMVRRFFDPSGPHGDIMRAANVPAEFVVIQRINLGLFALLGQLDATAQLAGDRRGDLALRRRPSIDEDGRGRSGLATGAPACADRFLNSEVSNRLRLTRRSRPLPVSSSERSAASANPRARSSRRSRRPWLRWRTRPVRCSRCSPRGVSRRRRCRPTGSGTRS